MKTKSILWKEIKVGDKFLDGSTVTKIHPQYDSESYKLTGKKINIFGTVTKETNPIIVSSNHLILCNTSKCSTKVKKFLKNYYDNFMIPTLYQKYYDVNLDNDSGESYYKVSKADRSRIGRNLYWLNANTINQLVNRFDQTILSNGYYLEVEYDGVKPVFCVETDTSRYLANGLIHHNSTALRNIIFHCITHGDRISIALVDLKLTEFTPYKGVKSVLAVANTIQEAAELVRIGRTVMKKRNKIMADLGIQNITDFEPKSPTDKTKIFGVEYGNDTQVEIKLKSGEVKKVTVKEIPNYFSENEDSRNRE